MTQRSAEVARIAGDAQWLAHRFDPDHDAVHFRHVPRAIHRKATFITDAYLPADAAVAVIGRSDAVAAAGERAPLHFVFHSAYCCSTMLARAFDLDGVAMGLKEPVFLNDLVGWKHRGGTPRAVAAALDDGLALLARPFSTGETIVVKPSNVTNAFAPAMLAMRPAARALCLHAPLSTYLGSIARKGMWGRLWARELFVKQLTDGLIDFGFSTADYLGQTDLQAAALGWLAQHALFARLVETYGATRVRTLDSETLVAHPAAVMDALGRLFDVTLDAEAVAAGPAFTQHSKSGAAFGASARARETSAISALDADEIDKVAVWAAAVADSQGVPMTLPAPLLA